MSAASRIDRAEFTTLTPGVSEALFALAKAINAPGLLAKDLQELVKLRASQLNGCAFCLQFHLNVARELGVPAPKLDLLATWREAPVYGERERLALEWAEALTLSREVEDALYERLLAEFGKQELALLTASIASINAWNRIAMSLRFTPPIPAGGA